MNKFIILTNKEDYQTILENEGLHIVETYDYYFFDQLKAKYSIAQVLSDDIKITLVEEKNGKSYINHIPIKFFESFETIEGAQEELGELSGPDSDFSHLKLAANR
ncbi:hypothetical protein [Alteribacillus iranensis]|uniref:Uncharacterized protein n=1 Tax=Alteribacillus iranensis TaxID=930128 RepID=A0A1I2E3U2_9BACI|nr:hypothetical protein [Alteribacillus iranensis]SFE87612.1 hypothetical protein SAMN05192532_10589 [Alteribacillus iranensis]